MSPDSLILSGSIGSGHDSVARACQDALASAQRDAVVLDCMSLLGPLPGRLGELAFRTLLWSPPIYDAFHFSGLRAGSSVATRSADKATGRLSRALAEAIGAPELTSLIAVFATGAGVVGWARRQRPDLGAFVVVTDATAHRVWVQPGVQRYVVFSALAAGSVRQYEPRADVVVVDPPVRPEFLEPPDPAEARAELGVEPGEPMVLVMGGGWGRGPLLDTAFVLAERGCTVVALVGSNRRLLRRGRRRAAKASRSPRVLGHTDQVVRLMAAADVVVTSPGQACHEARAVGRPLVITDTVPGHGRENLLGELARGGALASAPQPRAVARAVLAVLDGSAGIPLVPASPPAPDMWAKQFLQAISWP